jgi:hypothetical protein
MNTSVHSLFAASKLEISLVDGFMQLSPLVFANSDCLEFCSGVVCNLGHFITLSSLAKTTSPRILTAWNGSGQNRVVGRLGGVRLRVVQGIMQAAAFLTSQRRPDYQIRDLGTPYSIPQIRCKLGMVSPEFRLGRS